MQRDDEKQFVLWDTILHYFEMAFKIMRASQTSDEKRRSSGYASMFFNYFKELRIAKKENKPIIMTNFCFPPELIQAMQCYNMNQEIGSIALSIAKAGEHYIDLAEEHGVDKFQCNAQKVWIGASILREAPYPDVIVFASQPCDSTNIQYQVLSQIYDYAPVFTIDIPYWSYDPTNKYYNPNTVPYVSQQLKNFIAWLEEKIGRPMDHDVLRRIMENSNKSRELMVETMELMRAKPAPLRSLAAFNNYAIQLLAGGLPEAIDYAEVQRDLARERVKKKQGAMEARGMEEKIRVMWIYLPVFFEPFLFDWMERKFGAITVMDMAGYMSGQLIDTKNEDTMFNGLAKQMLDMGMGRQSRGPAEFYIDDMLRIGKDYDADCAIYGGHIGCKHSHAMAALMKEIIEKELGIPCHNFELDVVDSRPVTTRAIKRELKLFFTSLT